MIGLLSMRRLAVGLVVVLLAGGTAGWADGREPVLIHVGENPPARSIAFNFVTFAPNSDNLVLSCDGALSIWKAGPQSGTQRLVKRLKARGSTDYVERAAPIAVSTDGDYVAVPAGGRGSNIAWSNSIQVWDIAKGAVVGTYAAKEHRQTHLYFTFVPNSMDMYIAVEKSLEVWSPTTGKRRIIASAESVEGFAIQHMRILQDGLLATARADGRICLWDTKKPALKSFRNVRTSIFSVAYGGGDIRTHYIVLSPDAKRVAALDYVKPAVLKGDTLVKDATAGYTLTLWDLEKGKPIRTLPLGAGKRNASSVAWSSDGRFIAWVSHNVADADGSSLECVLWDVAKEKEIMREKPPTGIVIGGVVAFSPDGKLLAMPAGDNTKKALVAIWDISDLTKDEESRAESKRGKAVP